MDQTRCFYNKKKDKTEIITYWVKKNGPTINHHQAVSLWTTVKIFSTLPFTLIMTTATQCLKPFKEPHQTSTTGLNAAARILTKTKVSAHLRPTLNPHWPQAKLI